jgi:hypothetical protein
LIVAVFDLLPEASYALTPNEYVVPQERPISEYHVVVVVPALVLPFKISYPATPTLSAEACQESVMLVCVTALAVSPLGLEGRTLSLRLDGADGTAVVGEDVGGGQLLVVSVTVIF